MSVARASVIMIATLVASRVLGWLRLSVVGATFGGTTDLDAFIAAFRIPDAIFGLLVAGALAAAFIPVFTGYLAKEREEEAWRVASSVLNALLLLLIGASAVLWLAAPILVPTIIAPGFAHNPPELALTVDLTRLMLLSPIFMGLSALTTGILNSYRQFLSSAVAPLVYNAVIILFTFFAHPFLGIHAVATGVVVGALVMWLVQLPELTFRRTRYSFSLDLGHPGVRDVLRLAGHALVQVLARAYYASRDTATPLALTLISIGLNVVLDVLLAPTLFINGLALANAVSTLVEAALLLTLLATRARLRLVGLGLSSAKHICASLLMGVAMFAFIRATNVTVDLEQTKIGLALQTLVASAVGGAVYLAAAYLLRVSELGEIFAVVRTRIGR